MEVGATPAVVPNRAQLTPKAVIHQKFGKQASYTTEQVPESVQNGCPGLSIPQQGPFLYCCTLKLPEFSVTSEPCKRKKDAEQSAAKLAIEKLNIKTTDSIPTPQEAHDGLVSRITYLFSDEFLPSLHPLTGHLQEALGREGDPHGMLPLSILAACDSKTINLCKYINPEAESNILLILELIMKAVRLCSSVAISEENFWIRKQTPYTQEARQRLLERNPAKRDISVQALYIPCSVEEPIKPVSLNVLGNGYYMDVIAQKLGLMDASHVLVSRSVGKSSSEMRIYFSAPQLPLLLDPTSRISDAKENMVPDATSNARASYISGQDIPGDAILAAIGYTWRSTELFSEDISLGTYYRMLVGRLPDGGYKLSREAILAAELPLEYTSRTNWRGSFPKDLLCTFCRQNWLSEPVFSPVYIEDSSQSLEIPETCKKLKLSNSLENGSNGTDGVKSVGQGGTFRCEVKILSKNQDLIVECLPQDSFRKQNDAIQNASLKVLLLLSKYFMQLKVPLEKWSFPDDIHGVCVHPHNFRKEFALCVLVHKVQQNIGLNGCTLLGTECMDQFNNQNGLQSLRIEGPDSGVCPSNGSLACISYSISLKQEKKQMNELIESCDEFEFEVGNGAVTPLLESCVTQMSTNQSAYFTSELPSLHLILAAACDRASFPLSLQDCCLEYSVNLIRITEPLEARMEQALFSPPLSKQRVDFALKHINESGATTLVDFGCGSGSLLDSLANYPTSLKKIAGVDISRKGLTRAAKVLHSKLAASNTTINSVLLYEGSITIFDHRLYGFDIGTCLEVIEHMEEDQAQLFSDIVLGYFCPRILIVSTPNYEYNPILQKSTGGSNQEEKEDEKSESLTCKFRNLDHKFEWTRHQFNCWASDLASRYNYSVEFSGVGGCGDLEPGFASQIAVFKNLGVNNGVQFVRTEEATDPYEVIWEWDSNAESVAAAP